MGSLVSAAASLIGAGVQSGDVSNAANIQTTAGTQAGGYLTTANNQVQSNDQPWMAAGTGALSQMQGMTAAGPPQFTQAQFLANQDPAYGFDMQQGLGAVQSSAAAKGGLMSGGTMAAMNNYAQGMASNEYSNAYNRFMSSQNTQFNRLGQIAGMGQAATGNANGASMNYGTGMANLTTGIGQSQAGAQIAQGNIWGGAISNVGNTIGQSMTVNGLTSSMQGGGGSGGGAYMPAGAADPSSGGMYGSSALQTPQLGSSAGLGGSSMDLIAAGG